MVTVSLLLDLCNKQRFEIMHGLSSEIKRTSTKNLPECVPQFARIITGIRRCGKSTLVRQEIKQHSPNAFYLNFDEPALYDFSTGDFAILDEAISYFKKEHNGCNELYFDEIQSVKGWEIYINSKLREKNIITVTGSNASLLSQELGTRLTGRHLDYECFPFDFSEYCTLRKVKKTAANFSGFLEQGGFPEYLQYKKSEILSRLLDDILLRDIVIRHGIKDVRALKSLAIYLASNFGNLVTGSKLSAQLGLKTTATILEYLSFFEQSYLFSFVPKFDYSAKAQSVNPKKVYCIDTGLASNVSMSVGKDKGRLLENAVYIQLRRKTKNIWYYAEPSFECDFLYGKENVPEKAVQVCYSLTKENMEREVKGLVETCKKFSNVEPYIVTFNQTDKISSNGMIIPVIPAVSFFDE